jgi:hypothetical protein
MTNLAVIPMPVKKVRTIRRKRSRMIILTPQEILDLLKAARQRTEADGQRALFFRAALTGANTARSEIATCSTGVCIRSCESWKSRWPGCTPFVTIE